MSEPSVSFVKEETDAFGLSSVSILLSHVTCRCKASWRRQGRARVVSATGISESRRRHRRLSTLDGQGTIQDRIAYVAWHCGTYKARKGH